MKPAPAFGWSRADSVGLTFRPISDADLHFLARLYASTRAEELALTDWSVEQKAAFLQSQFDAQHAHYQRYYTTADFLVIEREGEPIGRLYLSRWSTEHRIVDIALVPEHCSKGFGSALIRDLLDEAEKAGKAVTIHVEKFNPAQRFYRRLDFAKVSDEGAYDLMKWSAPPKKDGDTT